MKKIAKLSIIMLLMIVGLTVNVYAKTDCNINMKTEQTEINKGKEFTIDVNLSDIESERGIIAIEATLEYDKDCLTLSKMEGQNDWDTPVKDLSYNESNGKLVIDKKGLAKSDETILKITFVVNETSKKDTTVSLKNIIVADGTVPTKISDSYVGITIKDKESKPDDGQNPGENQKPDEKPTPDENQKPDTDITTGDGQNSNQTTGNTNNKNNIATEKLPQTGKTNNITILLLVILLVVIAITGLFIYKKKKEMRYKI